MRDVSRCVVGGVVADGRITVGDGGYTRLSDLPRTSFLVEGDTSTKVIADEFERQPDLPGAIVKNGPKLVGCVSRRQLAERLSRPFGLELFMRSPIESFLASEGAKSLKLPAEMGVGRAMELALRRPASAMYEPILVLTRVPQGGYNVSLLDIDTLLVAQTRLLADLTGKLRQQKAIAEQANQAKSLFLANMSHEIRTPLTAILGYAESLQEEEMGPDDRAMAAETIVRNGQHLLNVINDILDLSKIESGRLTIEKIRCSPISLVADVVSTMRIRAAEKGLKLEASLTSKAPQQVMSDPTRLRQILFNLVSNAVKFTKHGSVTIGVSLEQSPQRWRFDVTDTGIGIAQEKTEELFENFTQADATTTRKFGGTGLGLAISRRLARMLGGDLTVRSEIGSGSTFTLEVEAEPTRDAWVEPGPVESARPIESVRAEDMHLPRRLLLADDSPDNRRLISSILKKWGATVDLAVHGRDAVDKAIAAEKEDRPYDVVLLDMQMPVLDGYAATRTLRDSGYALPIVALTANAMHGDEQRCIDSGCDGYHPKPIHRELLFQTLLKVSPEPLSSSQSPAIAPAGDKDLEQSKTTARDSRSSDDSGDVQGDPTLDTVSPQDFGEDTVASHVDPAVRTPSRTETASPSGGNGEDGLSFDPQQGLRRMAGDRELYAEILELVSDQVEPLLGDLRQARTSHRPVDLRRALHTLKNSAMNIGADAFADDLLALERTCSELESSGEVESRGERWSSFCDQVAGIEPRCAQLGLDIGRFLENPAEFLPETDSARV